MDCERVAGVVDGRKCNIALLVFLLIIALLGITFVFDQDIF